jgi:hypothetical protein
MAREARRLDALLHEALPRLRTPVIVGSGRRGFIWFAVIRVVFRRLVAFVPVRLLVHRAAVVGIHRRCRGGRRRIGLATFRRHRFAVGSLPLLRVI